MNRGLVMKGKILRKKRLAIIILIIVAIIVCFIVGAFFPKPLYPENKEIIGLRLSYETEDIELSQAYYDYLVENLSAVNKQLCFQPNRAHPTEDTYHVDFYCDNKPYHLVITEDSQWMYIDHAYNLISEESLYHVIKPATFEGVIDEIGKSYILVHHLDDENELVTAGVNEGILLLKEGQEISIEDLKVGDQVSIEYCGEVMETYPGQLVDEFKIVVQ